MIYKRGDSMAGTQFTGGKCKGTGQAKAMLRHDDKEMREVSEHSNADIDKTKTKQNFSIKGLSYEEKCKFYDERIRALDNSTNTNKRKDRVTMQSMIVYVPIGLSDADVVKWCHRASEILEKKYGAENHIDSDVHLDERHMYYDPEQDAEVMSRVHMHCNYIPEVNGKLNGKAFSSRRNIMDVNRQLDIMSKIEFNVSYMTGKGKHPSKSVEVLKNASNGSYAKVREEAEVLLEANQKWSENLKASEEALKTQVINNMRSKREMQEREEALKAFESDLQAFREDLQQQVDNFTLEREKWLKTKNTALEDEKKQLREQYEMYCNTLQQKLSLEYRRSSGRPLPQGIKDMIEQSKEDFMNDFSVNL